MSKKLFTELRSFAETTSVRGIPRVMKAKTRVTFVVWLVAVLTCAALLVWQLSVVLTRYFQYPISTVPVQAPAWQNPTFPDITICNLNPAVYDTVTDDCDLNDVIASINKTFSYTINESPIIDEGYYRDWFGQFLLGSIRISAAWDTLFFKCFTLRPVTSDLRITIRSLSVVLYADQPNNENNTVNLDALMYQGGVDSATNLDLYVTGVRVLVHAPGTAPNMAYGVNIATGTVNTIQLTQSVRTRLGPPYSNCTNKPYLPWDNTSDAYTQQYCVNTCIQQKLVDQCGCITLYVPQYTMAQLRKVNYRICEIDIDCDLGNFSGNTTVTDICFNAALGSDMSKCNVACVLPCSELQYDATTNVTPWPSSDGLGMLSNIYLSDIRFRHLFNISENATDDEIYAATTTSAATDFFKSRFLELNVEFVDQSIIELKDVAAFSADAMGAQIGGVLSLWLGVTVMFAFEAFEFIYIYLTNCCKEKPTQARRVSVAPGAQTDSPANSTQIGPTSTATSAETQLSESVVVQIE